MISGLKMFKCTLESIDITYLPEQIAYLTFFHVAVLHTVLEGHVQTFGVILLNQRLGISSIILPVTSISFLDRCQNLACSHRLARFALEQSEEAL